MIVRALLLWLLLMLLLAGQFGIAIGLRWSGAAPFIGLVMVVVVAFGFMHLRESANLMRIFALSGLVWLGVLLGLGSLDAFTRHDVPVGVQLRR